MDPGLREQHPDYSHRLHYIFITRLAENGEKWEDPTEPDSHQVGCTWVELASLEERRILPPLVGKYLRQIIDGTAPLF